MTSSHKKVYANLTKISLVLATFIAGDYLFASTKLPVSGAIRGNDWRDLLLTKGEKQKLEMFQEKVLHRLPEDYMKTDFYLIRWLRAKNFNLQNAETMLLENLNWREQHKISNILNEDFSDISEEFPVTLDGNDKQGRPIAILDMGDWNLRSAAVQGRMARVLRYMDWFQEKLMHKIFEAQKGGKNVTRAIVVVDVEKFSIQHLCPSSPAASRIGLQAVKPVMSPQTREVLKIFDTNKRQWISYLDERIEKDQLYINFGGTKKPKDY